MSEEIWKPVVGYEGLYLVSSLGRVSSVKSGKLMKLCPQESRGRKYLNVCLSKDGKSRKIRVHRLVADAFNGNPNGYPEVDHINNNPLDNRYENLRWCLHKDNMRNPYTRESERRYKLKHPYRPDTSVFFNRHDAERKQIVQIKDGIIIAKYESLGETERNGFKKVSVSACIHGRLKTYRGYEWMLLSDYKGIYRDNTTG